MSIRNTFSTLLKEPGKAFIVAFILGWIFRFSKELYGIFGLPEIAQVSDNLTPNQILLGEGIGVFTVLIALLALLAQLLLIASIIYFFYRILFKSRRKSLSK